MSGGVRRWLYRSARGVIRIASPKKIRNDTTATTAAAVKAMPRKSFSVINASNEAISAEKSAFWYASERVGIGAEGGRRSMKHSIPKGHR